MITTVTDRGVLEIDREEFAKIVRGAWSEAVRATIKDAPSSWTKTFDELPEHMKETERLQGELILRSVNEALAHLEIDKLIEVALLTLKGDDNCRNGKPSRRFIERWSIDICVCIDALRKAVSLSRKERVGDASTS